MPKKEILRQIIEAENKFWSEQYPKYSYEKKKKYWLTSTYEDMKNHGELGDKYYIFSKEWYSFAKKHESNFDHLFAEAVKGLGFDFNWNEYKKRIRE